MNWLIIGSVTEQYKEALHKNDKKKLSEIQKDIHQRMLDLYGEDNVKWLYSIAKGEK